MLTFYYISVLTTNFQTKPFQKPPHSHSPKAVKILWKNIHMGKFYSRNSFLAIFAMFTFVADIYEHVHNFWNPIFGQVVAFYEFSKRYVGILPIFWFLAIFGGSKLKNWQKSAKNHFFWTPDPHKRPKIKKLAKFPSNVWKTHKMQQLGQKWGSKSYLEPKKEGFAQFSEKVIFTDFWKLFNFGPPKMAQNQN